MVVAKPAGLAVHRGLARAHDTLTGRVRARLGLDVVHLAHRLDAGTSGAVVVAKHARAARALARSFAAGDVQKRYLALVRGALVHELVIDHPVPVDEGGARAHALTRVSSLAVVVVEGSALREVRYSLVAAEPESGRFHQLRRHLKHVAHPIIGDTTYGKSEHNRLCAARFGLTRLALHAWHMSFPHPSSGERVVVVAPPPEDLAAPLARMGFTLPTPTP